MLHRPQSTLIPQIGHEQVAADQASTHTFRNGATQAANDHFKPCLRINDPQQDAPVSLGTTILAVKFDGGVVLAADSRTSSGSYVVNRVANKLTKLTDQIYCCRSGSAADTQCLAEMTARYVNTFAIDEGARQPLVSTAASLIQKLCYSNRWSMQAGIIVAGYDAVNGGSVFNIPLGGSSIQHNYAMGGSGSVFLMGWMDANYKANMTKPQCVNFVRQAIAHAISRDCSSGGVCRTMTIDKDGCEHSMTPWHGLPFKMETCPEFKNMVPAMCGRKADSKTGKNRVDSTEQV